MKFIIFNTNILLTLGPKKSNVGDFVLVLFFFFKSENRKNLIDGLGCSYSRIAI